jgi:RNA polymerase sigma-70 factor (family 1)
LPFLSGQYFFTQSNNSYSLIGKSKITDFREARLLHSIKLDDRTSFEQLYKQYWPKLYIYAFNVLRERDLCEDIVQEVFMDLWAKRHEVQISNLHAYLYQSVKYQIFNHFRESKYKNQLLMKFDQINTQYELDELYEQKEFKAKIKEVIYQLPEQRRVIFEMSRYEGLSNKEISEHLSISVQTVKNQISESLKFIRKSLNSLFLLFF